MSKNSKIEWTDNTFNPWWGCTKVSEACKNCYAETLDDWLFHGDHWGPGKPRRTLGAKHWNEPRKWNAQAERAGIRQRVFCASMADVFDEEAPAGERDKLWRLIRETPWLDWQLLTKRPHRIAECLPPDWGEGYENVWLGCSVENQRWADERIPILVNVPAKIRFLSVEPLLDPIDRLPLDGIHWVIVGGESGRGARQTDPAWIRSIRDRCVDHGVAFFFKQWGVFGPGEGGLVKLGKKLAGRELDGRTWDEFPQTTVAVTDEVLSKVA